LTNAELRQQLTESLALLGIPGIGSGRYRRLVEAFGSPTAVNRASLVQLQQVSGISRKIASTILEQYDVEAAGRQAARIIQMGWDVLFHGHDGYPARLAQISDAPAILFRDGKGHEDLDHMIAVVGTRHATEKGRLFTRQLAAGLARAGVTVVSGMAEGIDTEAHVGALEAGGPTVAVWGSSLDIVYPSSNRDLARRIMADGYVYSEYPPGTKPDKSTFPTRNRIISGLAEGTVVVEAGRKSGALITASQALGQGREVFAVPGAPDNAMSEGANTLLKQGAHVITSAEDILAHLPNLRGEVRARRFRRLPNLTPAEKRLTDLMAAGPVQVDQLARDTQTPTPQVMGLLLALEMKGAVRELSGKRFALMEDPQ